MLTEHGCPIAPSHLLRGGGRPPSARALRDERAGAQIVRVHAENYGVYGARKVWLALNREGRRRRPVHRRAADEPRGCPAPCAAGGSGPRSPTRRRSGRRTWSTASSTPPAPDRLWVADFTYCPTWSGMVYVAFVIDAYSRRILGWRAATTHAHRPGARRPRAGHLDPRAAGPPIWPG